MQLEAQSVSWDGSSIAFVHGIDDEGREVRVAAEPRMAADIGEALAFNEPVLVDYEAWQVRP